MHAFSTLPGPTMMTGTEGSAGSLKLLARGRTRPSNTPPAGVAAMLAEAAPLCTRPAGQVHTGSSASAVK